MITTGGSRPTKYRHQVRIGNWSEEWELEKTRLFTLLIDKKCHFIWLKMKKMQQLK